MTKPRRNCTSRAGTAVPVTLVAPAFGWLLSISPFSVSLSLIGDTHFLGHTLPADIGSLV